MSLHGRLGQRVLDAAADAVRGGRFPGWQVIYARIGVEMVLDMAAFHRVQWAYPAVWRSREALDEYRRLVETPGGVLIFRAAGAEPTLSICEVAVHYSGPSATSP